jgi:hypothetical protein
MRICPKCGAFDGDGLSQFCLADGSVLLEVDPSSQQWSEGERFVRDQNDGLKRTLRRVKRWRVLRSLMTMMVVTVVVCVAAINGVVYLAPPREPVSDKTATSTGKTNVLVLSDITDLKELPITDIKNLDKKVVTPKDSSSSDPVCTKNEKSEIYRVLRGSNEKDWVKSIWSRAPDAPEVKTPVGIKKGKVELKSVSYAPTFNNQCDSVSISASYAWELTTFVNGREERIRKSDRMKFTCRKRSKAWSCRKE